MASEEMLRSPQEEVSMVFVGNTCRLETLVSKHCVQSAETPILCLLLR